MTRDQLRKELLSGIDAILNHPLFTNSEQKRLLRVQRSIIASNDSVVDAILAAYLLQMKGV